MSKNQTQSQSSQHLTQHLNPDVITPQPINISSSLLCYHCGSNQYVKKDKPGTLRRGTVRKQSYRCKDCGRTFVENPEKRLSSHLVDDDDIITAKELGLHVQGHTSRYKLNFRYIEQDWLKVYAKKFVRYMAATRTISTLKGYVSAINDFSKYLEQDYSDIIIHSINRSTILDYINYLNRKNVSGKTKETRLLCLKTFFEIGLQNEWFLVPQYLIRSEDLPKRSKALPRYIPEEVMQQLNRHLDDLPSSVMRMVLVIQECGMRIGELCQLPFDCLKQDGKDGWFIQFMRWKMKTEDTIPISLELAKVIQEQQQYIRNNLGNNYGYLFCTRKSNSTGHKDEFIPKPAIMKLDSFVKYLKQLAEKFDIRDNSGKRWNFQTHQFRHTVGTRMINNGVPQHIVQRYLGHESPAMTAVYAHIYDETLRKEIEKFHATKVVNVAGQVVAIEQSPLENDLDLEWFKKTVLAQALPNGYCGRPKVLGYCNLPPNSCLGCVHFRTNKYFLDVHKDELERTKKIINKALAHGWEVQVSMNEQVKNNLENIIQALESDES